jgi:hypothetical protein
MKFGKEVTMWVSGFIACVMIGCIQAGYWNIAIFLGVLSACLFIWSES